MRTNTDATFNVDLNGPEGPYTLRFVPDASGREGHLIVHTDDTWSLFGSVEQIEQRATGEFVLTGMGGPLADDIYWYELVVELAAPRISYWGDRVVHRVDTA